MEIKSKEILYAQLVEMAEYNIKDQFKQILSKVEFMKLDDVDLIKYIFKYRDTQTVFEGEQKYIIEIPDMDLSNRDLSDVYISDFLMKTKNEKGEYVPSCINFNNSRAKINLSDSGYTREEVDENGIIKYIVDFSNVNFKGCKIFGRLPDEVDEIQDPNDIIQVIGKEQGLDEEYLKRRSQHKLNDEQKKVTERAYAKLKSSEEFYRMQGRELIDFTDYDFSSLDIMFAMKMFCIYNLDFENIIVPSMNVEMLESMKEYLGISQTYRFLKNVEEGKYICNTSSLDIKNMIEFFLQNITINNAFVRNFTSKSRESYETEIYRLCKDMQSTDNILSLRKSEVFKDMKNYGTYLVYCKCRHCYLNLNEIDGNIKQKLLKDEMYSVFDYEEILSLFDKLNENKKKEIIQVEYEKGNLEFVSKVFGYLNKDLQKEIIQNEYEKGNLEFVSRVFGCLTETLQKEIIQNEYEKGNLGFVIKKFNYLTEDSKKEIIQNKYEKGNLEFVSKVFYYLNKDLQKAIIQKEYEKGNLEFVSKVFGCLTKTSRKVIVQSEYEKGNLEFVSGEFGWLDGDTQKEIVQNETEKQNWEFLKKVVYYMTPDDRTEVNKICMQSFLRTVLGLSDQEIINVEEEAKKMQYVDMYNESPEIIELKQKILEICNIKTSSSRNKYYAIPIITNSVEIMYSRLMFFKENNIEIVPYNLTQTLLISRKKFDALYGKYFLDEHNDNNFLAMDSKNIRSNLLNKYRLPATKKEFISSLETLKKEESLDEKEIR